MKYSCRNCVNLKTKVITKSDLTGISKLNVEQALKAHDPDSLDLMFPFNMTVYKRIKKDGRCKIIYCGEHLFNRDLYIFRENMDIDKLIPHKRSPCLKYK